MNVLLTRLAGLTRRAKILLAIASVVLVIAVVGGVLLALNPSLQARVTRALPGAANCIIVSSDGCEPP